MGGEREQQRLGLGRMKSLYGRETMSVESVYMHKERKKKRGTGIHSEGVLPQLLSGYVILVKTLL